MAHFNRRRRWCWLTTTAIVVCSASFLQVAGEDTKNAGTLKSVSRLVVVDTIVTDSSGQPLRGLKAEDFSHAFTVRLEETPVCAIEDTSAKLTISVRASSWRALLHELESHRTLQRPVIEEHGKPSAA